MTMDGGDLKTRNRRYGGDLATTNRPAPVQGGFLGLLGKLFGLGAGVSPAELQKAMSDPIKQQMLMQRGGFPWAMAAMSLLPMLLQGKGGTDVLANQMKATPAERPMLRGGLAIPPGLMAKALPLLKGAAIPLAFGALSTLGNKAVDAMFGDGIINGNAAHPSEDYRVEYAPQQRRGGRASAKRGKTTARKATGAKRGRTTSAKRGRTTTRKTAGVKRRSVKRASASTGPSLTKQLQNMVLDAAKATGERALDKAKSRVRRAAPAAARKVAARLTQKATNALPAAAEPTVNRFHQRVDDSISKALRAATVPGISSAHIGQSFNI